MQWVKNRNNCYTSYKVVNGKTIVFEVTEDGHYLATVNAVNRDIVGNGVPTSLVYMSGFCHSCKNAMEYLDKYGDSEISADRSSKEGKDKEEKEVKEEIKEVISDPILNDLGGEKISIDEFEKTDENETTNSSKGEWKVVTALAAEGNVLVTMSYISDIEGTVIKYTTNGKNVMITSKIYREPFVVPAGSTLRATVFVNKERIDEYSKVIW